MRPACACASTDHRRKEARKNVAGYRQHEPEEPPMSRRNRSCLSIARLRKSSLEKHAPDTCRRNVLCRPAVATRDSTRLDSDDSPRPDARRWPATSRQKGSLGYSRLETRPSACARNPRHRPGLACARRRSAGERRRRQVPARARSAHGSRA